MSILILLSLFLLSSSPVRAQSLTVVELNCENLFDNVHDSLKQDTEYLPEGTRHWTRKRYWRKINNIAQELLSTTDDGIPDLIALCEVENDSVLTALAHRSLLRTAGYEYLMTNSPDLRGIDVALLYSPATFAPISHHSIRVVPVKDMRPTRDILYVSGKIKTGDTLHVFVVHAPSRFGGERHSRPFRLQVADALCQTVDSIMALSPAAKILVTGDFNDYDDSPALQRIGQHQLRHISRNARGLHGAKGTYCYQGLWRSLDHMLVSPALEQKIESVNIHAPLFLLEEDPFYGGYRPPPYLQRTSLPTRLQRPSATRSPFPAIDKKWSASAYRQKTHGGHPCAICQWFYAVIFCNFSFAFIV